MLGNAMLRVLATKKDIDVVGTARNGSVRSYFQPTIADRIIAGVDVENVDALTTVFARCKPQVVINCIGLVKQHAEAEDPLQALPVNAMLPHRLARLCQLSGARLVHVSTDCVFNGKRGNYRETDPSDAEDLYGRSKYIGEVLHPHAVTLRTSIIGHELASAHGLIGWFLAQKSKIKGYRRAIFSGLPTVALARLVSDTIIPRPDLFGLFHVASEPISKFDLLGLVASEYGIEIEIEPDDTLAVDRSLNAELLRNATGYVAAGWPELVAQMCKFK